MINFPTVADEAQETLDWFVDQEAAAESFEQVVKLVDSKEPALSEEVKLSFRSCTRWDGDYYCQDEHWRWHFVDLR